MIKLARYRSESIIHIRHTWDCIGGSADTHLLCDPSQDGRSQFALLYGQLDCLQIISARRRTCKKHFIN